MDLMGWLTVVTLILTGLLAASALILGKRPDAKAMMDKIAPFEGIIGCVGLVIAIIALIRILPNIGSQFNNVHGIVGFVGTLALLGAGFLLSLSVIGKFLGQGGANIAAKLAPFKVLMGVICLALGIFIPLNFYLLKM